MNITLTTTRQTALEREAAARSTEETTVTADDIAQSLLDSACDSYAATQADAYARDLYARIKAAPANVQQAIFTSAENALKP